ncbi:MAG: hypothetical protein QNJ97_01895 [Myxococcota bacterium]|nr:hypothetical protein [Myxococcota bacterium]
MTGCLFLGCTDASTDDPDVDTALCSPIFCRADCLESCVDGGLPAWGGCEGLCVVGKGCRCSEYLCYPQNCETWCIETQDAGTGTCSVFDCLCE